MSRCETSSSGRCAAIARRSRGVRSAGRPDQRPDVRLAPNAVSTATLLADGRILLTGQVDRDANWAAIYDPAAQRWQEIDRPTSWSPSAVRLADGRVLLLGGITDGNIRPEGGGQLAPAVATMQFVR